MTVRIKELRGEPLLTLPPEGLMPSWARLTQEDRMILEKKAWTSETDDVKAVFAAYALSIGLDVKVEPAVESTLRKNLEYFRGEKYGRQLVHTQILLKALGFKSRLTAKDRVMAKEAFDAHRIWGGYDIASFHHDMKALDIAVPVSAEDRAEMGKSLEKLRKGRNGFELAKMHYWMREFGVGERITARDEELMEADLGRLRRVDHFNLAWMHQALQGIYMGDETPRKGQLPPLRRFET